MTLNPELWMVVLPALGWFLFALGGTEISTTIKGQKWIRRFIFPLILGLCILLAGFAWWKALACALIACIALHQGYGSKASWTKRVLIFTSYGLVSLPLGISFWNGYTIVVAIVCFILSNWKPTSNIYVWKFCEGFMGLSIGMQVAFLLSGNGLIW
jgi:fatty acid desaturase